MAEDKVAVDTLRVELCGRLADACGREVELELPAAGLSVPALLAALRAAHPLLDAPLARARVRACVNDMVVPDDTVIRAGDLVALFPPVSGG